MGHNSTYSTYEFELAIPVIGVNSSYKNTSVWRTHCCISNTLLDNPIRDKIFAWWEANAKNNPDDLDNLVNTLHIDKTGYSNDTLATLNREGETAAITKLEALLALNDVPEPPPLISTSFQIIIQEDPTLNFNDALLTSDYDSLVILASQSNRWEIITLDESIDDPNRTIDQVLNQINAKLLEIDNRPLECDPNFHEENGQCVPDLKDCFGCNNEVISQVPVDIPCPDSLCPPPQQEYQ